MRNPKCPNCNEEILWNENIEANVYVDEIFLKCQGHCLECEKDFEWEEKFVFEKYYEPKEVKI